MNLDVLVGRALVLPLTDPVLENLPHVSAGDWDLLDAEDPQRRSVEHLLNSARG